MSTNHATLDGLEELREWNRLFLVYLRNQLAHGQHPIGLPLAAGRALGKASTDTVERMADFPQALFRLRLPGPRQDRVAVSSGGEPDPACRAIQLALLVIFRIYLAFRTS
jgi:hypothetical protein